MKRAHVVIGLSLAFALGLAPGLAQAATQSKSPRLHSWTQKAFFPARPKSACIIPTPQVSLSPPSLAFGPHPPGAYVPGQSFTISNIGTAPLQLSSISATGGVDSSTFSVEGSCTFTTIAPGQSCTEDVYFSTNYDPPGSYTRIVEVYSNAPGSPHGLPASGTITPGGPVPGFQRTPPGSIALGSANVGSTTLAVPITITNTGGAPLEIQPPSLGTGLPFYFSSNSCPIPPATVAPGGSCQMEFRMTPLSAGPQSDTKFIIHNAAGGSHAVNLTGFGVAPGAEIEFDPTSVYFGLGIVGTNSGTSVYVKNVGATPLVISAVTLPVGPFSITGDSCTGQTLATDEDCNVGLQFTAPMTVGYYDAYLSVTSNSPSSPSDLYLSGEAINPAPALSPSSGYFDFGALDVSAPAACTTITVTNADAPGAPDPLLSYYMNSYSGAFTLGNGTCPTTCGSTLDGGQSCTLGFYFDPSTPGPDSAYLEIFDPLSYSYWYVDLEGTGTLVGPQISLDQYFVDFGTQLAGVASAPRTVTVTNSGNAPLNITSISDSSPFLLTITDCIGPPIAPSASCTATFIFNAAGPDGYSGSIYFNGDAVAGQNYFDVYGVATSGPEPSVDFFPESMDFGNVVVNQSSTPRSISFANTGSAPLEITSISTSDSDVNITHDCPLAPATLAPNACCTITGVYAPTSENYIESSLYVFSNAPDAPHYISLSGQSVPPPSLTASPPSLAFPPAIVGSSPPPLDMVVTNTGITPITFTGMTTSGDFFLYDPLSPPGVAPPPGGKSAARRPGAKSALPSCVSMGNFAIGQQCALTIWFAPSALGLRTGVATINFANGQGSPVSLDLIGASMPAASPGIGLSTDSIAFGDVVIDTVSATRPIVISSTGTSALGLNGLTVRGPFRIASNCPALLDPGLSCVVDVAFMAGALGPAEGDITIEHSAEGVFRRVFFTANGVPVPKPRIVVGATGLVFGNQMVGTTSRTSQRFSVRNAGNATLTLGAIVPQPGFPLTTTCGGSLEPDRECVVDVGFTPAGAGRTTATVSIPSNDPERAVVPVALSGTGCRIPSMASLRLGASSCNP